MPLRLSVMVVPATVVNKPHPVWVAQQVLADARPPGLTQRPPYPVVAAEGVHPVADKTEGYHSLQSTDEFQNLQSTSTWAGDACEGERRVGGRGDREESGIGDSASAGVDVLVGGYDPCMQ